LHSSLAACSSALRSSLAALDARVSSLFACSSAPRSLRSRPARALFVPRSRLCMLEFPRSSLALPLSHLWTSLCASTDCYAARAGLPSLFSRVRRAAVDAHGASASLWTRTVLCDIPLPSPVAHSPDVTVSRARLHAEHPGAAARRGLSARPPCSCAEARVCSLECSFTVRLFTSCFLPAASAVRRSPAPPAARCYLPLAVSLTLR